MALPINIEELVNAKTIESSRIEFKKGWNPYNILRTVCAFSNDIDEIGGGYIIVGIEENDGQPILPPFGLEQKTLDTIQQEFFKLCQNDIKESVFPQIEITEFQGKWIIVIWVTTGDERPYSASNSPGKSSQKVVYVRHGSVTKEASRQQNKQLQELANINYYDSRINQKASISDLDLSTIQSYLQETGASLFEESTKIPFPELCVKMGIAKGPLENIKPINAGLLLFGKEPDKFFPGCKTNLVVFKDEDGSEIDYSLEFKGPVQLQIREILNFFKSNIIKKQTTKIAFEAEADTYDNYPFQALEEVIVNSLYHRSFEDPEPNQIRIFNVGERRRIEVSSFPGPLAPIDQDTLLQERVPPKNRNIKLGDSLKYLKLTEKFGSGIPTIRKAMRQNGSLEPQFITDKDKTHFMAVLNIHPDWIDEPQNTLDETAKGSLSNKEQLILEKLTNGISIKDLKKLLKKEISNSEINQIVFKLKEEKYISEKKISLFFGLYSVTIYNITPKGENMLKGSF
ncbi:RNA-binding domain-containing protein [Chryseobacterium oranimense]|uniref:RNA-binding domain-containing protein n=1 Tax=Chryseobacterium oranimense TaxID=421058 RepID=UPI0031DBBFDF